MPDMHLYYQAVHCLRVVDWFRHSQFKRWTRLEYTQANGLLQELVWSTKLISLEIRNHPTFGASLAVIGTLLLKGRLGSLLSLNLRVAGCREWKVSQFTDAETWPTTADLIEEARRQQISVWGAFQAGQFFRNLPPSEPTEEISN